jgi:hypothetical protein
VGLWKSIKTYLWEGELTNVADAPDAQGGETSQEADRDTGPIPRFRFWPFGGRRGRVVESGNLSHYERRRKLIESFNEDALELTDKIKLKTAKWLSIILPIIAVWAIGSELGQFFSNGLAFSWANQWAVSQYLIAYAGEVALAAMTYVLGFAAGQKSDGAAHNVKLTITFLVWFLFLAASAVGQWFTTVSVLHPTGGALIAVGIRIGMACSLDIAAVCLMWWRGQSLARFLEKQMKTQQAITAVNESELAIEAAQASADRRRQEDEQYQESKRRHEDVLIRLEEMQGQALIAQAERMLLPGQGGSSRDRASW